MTGKLKVKKIIAREIILFFSVVVLLVLITTFLFCRNFYYEQKYQNLILKKNSLVIELNKFPKDKINELYNQIKDYLIVNYEFNDTLYAVTKIQSSNFLYDESGNRRNVTLLPSHKNGFSFYKRHGSLNILAKDSILVFDFVELELFRKLISDKNYQENLFSVFSKKTNSSKLPPKNLVVNGDGLPIFNIYEPYNATFDFGTIEEFENYIQSGLKFTIELEHQKADITNDYYSTEKLIDNAKENVWDNEAKIHFLLYTALIFGIILYPLRLIFIVVKWAIKTLQLSNPSC